ncbi:MAG: hypothetical protein DRJ64_01345 [Thermoprotei archaeon]|nr:MAG: hypothetical protein DRJ64_01345 [Thermoprotei archaeon]
MDQENLVVIALALTSALSNGTSAVLSKYSTYKIKPIIVNFLRSLTGTTVLLILISLIDAKWYTEITFFHAIVILYIAFTGPVLAWYLYIKSLSLGDVSLVHPITNTYPFVAILMALILFHESPDLLDILGGFFILFGIRNITYRKKSKDSSLEPILYSIMVSILWGVNTVLFKLLLYDANPLSLALLRSASSAVIMLPLALMNIDKNIKSPKHVTAAICTGLTSDAAGVILWLLSLQMGEISTVAILSSTSPIFSAVFSQIFLKERPSTKRWMGILGTVIGITLISI